MAKPVPLGTRFEVEETVQLKHTLQFHHPMLPPIYSTPDMIRLMETACFQALLPYHEAGEMNVGTAINVEHRAATGVGAKVKAEGVLESFDGRFYVMRVRAWDERQEIGRGTVTRAMVHLPRLMKKVEEKK